MSRILETVDGLLIETDISQNREYEISSIDKVDTSVSQIKELLNKVVAPIGETYHELSKKVDMEEAKLTLGVKVSGEGGFIIAKTSAEANFKIEVLLRKNNA